MTAIAIPNLHDSVLMLSAFANSSAAPFGSTVLLSQSFQLNQHIQGPMHGDYKYQSEEMDGVTSSLDSAFCPLDVDSNIIELDTEAIENDSEYSTSEISSFSTSSPSPTFSAGSSPRSPQRICSSTWQQDVAEFVPKQRKRSTNLRDEAESGDYYTMDICIDQCGIPLPWFSKSDYYSEPSLESMKCMTTEQLRHIANFTIGRYGYGHVKFEGEIDITTLALDLNKIVRIRHAEFQLYPRGNRPLAGYGLNRPAVVSLLRCKPREVRKCKTQAEATKVMEKLTIELGALMLSYHHATGTWCFRV